jgi:hypothetical protein
MEISNSLFDHNFFSGMRSMTALNSSGLGRSMRGIRSHRVALLCSVTRAALTLAAMGIFVSAVSLDAGARPSSKAKSSSGMEVQTFLRQTNVFSNMEFFYTNRGVEFNAGQGQNEGLFWPRGSGESYIFGGGLWFATEKEIGGKRHKLCDLGYNPNSGAGWYLEGEASQVGLNPGTDGANPAAKYISYVGPRYDRTFGKYVQGSSSVVPSPFYSWPLWDTSATKTINHNFYFGDYISDVTMRNITSLETANPQLAKIGKTPAPAITSEEDILSFYSDADHTNNPEYRPNTGYPFGIDIQEEIYSWSFGRYRDMIFERHKVTNSSTDSLLDCWMAPAYDPDLDAAVGGAANDLNSYVDSALVAQNADPGFVSQLREPYRSDPTKLNMGVQWRNFTAPPNGKQYGWIGFSFLESPVKDSKGNIVANDDSVGLGGYGPDSLFQKNQLGLVTFRDWIILNDPSTEDLRYNFVSAGTKDGIGIVQDQRLLLGTGPFTLPPGKSVETVVGIAIAQVDNNSYKKNFGALLLLMDFAHQVFGEVDSTPIPNSTQQSYFLNHFLSPTPPNIPIVTTTALDKAVLVTWDNSAELTHPKLLTTAALQKDTTLSFLGYQLWRTTRSDHDSTIRPDGNNPDVMLGQWQLYNFTTDSVFDSKGHFNHLHYTRTNTIPNPIPHSYLDVGDDAHQGVLTGNEGLFNNVTYYYYVIAFNEYDSLNQVGPLYSSIVPPKNFVPGIPNRPVYLASFSADTASNVNTCNAGSGKIGAPNPGFGGVQDVRLEIADTGIFAKLFTNDTVNVSFQPRWTEFLAPDASPCYFYVDVTDTRNGIQNTYANLQNAANSTSAYSFPTSLPGTIVYHVDGTFTPDSVFGAQFTTDNAAFAPNQKIDQAFTVLADVNLEQLSTPYRLDSVTVSGPGNPAPNILRLSRRTNNSLGNYDSNQNIYHLPKDQDPRPPVLLLPTKLTLFGAHVGDTIIRFVPGTTNDTVYTLDTIVNSVARIDSNTNAPAKDTFVTYVSFTPIYHYTINSTRPAFLGALGETSYEVTFGSPISPGPVPVQLVVNGDTTIINPHVLPIIVTLASCPLDTLRPVPVSTTDSANEMTLELLPQFYADQLNPKTGQPYFDDPDKMYVPIPGWYEMSAFHYTDVAAFNQAHTNAVFAGQGPLSSSSTTGPYYFPIGGNDNIDSKESVYHLTVHVLRIGGAEIIFNAPEVPDNGNETGDSIAGLVVGIDSGVFVNVGGRVVGYDSIVRYDSTHVPPHMNDFQTGDVVTLNFTGMAKNLPFPGAQFTIHTERGSHVDFANTNNYVDSILAQVQVVPNPYIVTHIGQTSTDNAKLFFTRLPPRCTIEIYALDGTLVTTIEHYGYRDTTIVNAGDAAQTHTQYFTSPAQLSDQSSVETWNLLTSGLQRVGSQVLFARVVAKDPNSNAEIGEVTTKFAVVVGLSK